MRALREDQARMHLVMMLALTFTTGIVDAVGYLALDRVFIANMTGNVVILGMGLAQADDLPVLGPVIGLGGFLLGAALGGRALKGARTGWSGRTTVLIAVVGTVTLAAAGAVALATPVRDTPYAYSVTAVLALVMGVQAAGARRLAVADVTTVVVTSTIVGLASESRLAGGTGRNAGRRVLAVLLIGAGAGVGALLLRAHLGVGLAVAGALTVGVALFGHLVRERAAAEGDSADRVSPTGSPADPPPR